MLKLDGKDNYGKPRQEFAEKIAGLDDRAFENEAKDLIWLSAYAANNRRSDYHWQAYACYHEAQRRGKPELYKRAHQRASA